MSIWMFSIISIPQFSKFLQITNLKTSVSLNLPFKILVTLFDQNLCYKDAMNHQNLQLSLIRCVSFCRPVKKYLVLLPLLNPLLTVQCLQPTPAVFQWCPLTQLPLTPPLHKQTLPLVHSSNYNSRRQLLSTQMKL